MSPVYAQIRDWAGNGPNDPNSCLVDGVPTLKCLEVVFSNLIFMASALVLVILFIMLVVGGWTYLTSFGSPEKVKKAQGTMKYAIIGLVLYLLSFLILKIIDTLFLGGTGAIFKFEIPTN